MDAKYEKVSLPDSNKQLLAMAAEREAWADTARRQDMHGTAKEWELTALLLREVVSLREADMDLEFVQYQERRAAEKNKDTSD